MFNLFQEHLFSFFPENGLSPSQNRPWKVSGWYPDGLFCSKVLSRPQEGPSSPWRIYPTAMKHVGANHRNPAGLRENQIKPT